MKNRNIAIAGILLMSLAPLAGCKSNTAFVKTAKDYRSSVGSEFLLYTDADPALTPEQKARRHRTDELFGVAIREEEKK